MTVSVTCDADSIVAVLARLVARCHSSELQMTAAKWFVSLYFDFGVLDVSLGQ